MRYLDSTRTQAHIRRIGIENASSAAFAYLDKDANTRYDWHTHTYHQLLYSVSGTAQVEVGRIRYFLQPQRAAWISAGVPHRTTIGDLAGVSVFFQPSLVSWTVDPIRVFAAPPLLRAMVWEAIQWAPESEEDSELRDLYFRTLALLCRNWMRQEAPFWLPNPSDPQLSRSIEYTLENLQNCTVEKAGASAAMSVRTFRRHFAADLGITWRDYVLKARLLLAIDLLSRPGARIIDVAGRVGFDSPSAFSKAFLAFTGERPREYKLRVGSVSFPGNGNALAEDR